MSEILLASRNVAIRPIMPVMELATNWGRLLPKSLFMMLKFGLGDSKNAYAIKFAIPTAATMVAFFAAWGAPVEMALWIFLMGSLQRKPHPKKNRIVRSRSMPSGK